MKKCLLLFVLLGAMMSVSAQQVEPVYKPLITKRTADWCPNCGSWGWTFFHWLLEDNDDKAVIWAVHHSGGLETTTSGAIADNFQGFSQPIFYLNEVDQEVHSTNMSEKRTEIAQQVDAMGQQMPIAAVGLHSWIEGDMLQVDARVEFFQNADGTWRLGLYLVEKERVAPQANQGNEAIHKRLLRTALTDDVFGELITDMGAPVGLSVMSSFSHPLTDPIWTDDNLIVVAVLWKKEGQVWVPMNATQTDDFEQPTATTEREDIAVGWHVWPNPAHQFLYVSVPASVDARALSCTLKDVHGRHVPTRFVRTGRSWQADVTHLPKGCYFLHARQRDGRVTVQRVFIQ